jgi:hypothetical protein
MKTVIYRHRDEDGQPHRPWQEGPAYCYADGTQFYYEHGKRHRPVTDGPARIFAHGTVEYWENDIHLWTASP